MAPCKRKAPPRRRRFKRLDLQVCSQCQEAKRLEKAEKKALLTWASPKPTTQKELKRQREEFWDTQPTYSGRIEIWQALKAACETSDDQLAQIIIDSANVKVPTGNLADGCYDELGNQYVIPLFCIVNPTNLAQDGPADSSNTGSENPPVSILQASHLASRKEAAGDDSQYTTQDGDVAKSTDERFTPRTKITARLSTAKDLKLELPEEETVMGIRKLVQAQEHLDPNKQRTRVFYMGKQLSDEVKIGDVPMREGSVLQIMITPL
ncbi:uncharacterized protein BJ171DRAFT_598832 [Polychytrium aggregatum]|uniref:uncharacterized protein n=1 Tax=Polychytrium aggregatum TaxID=110093 RepID=UPI0022FDFDAD|nr:uncharacterized protein BJ171DRAFT_598832 [Polychytrium aggregatum]KAI9204802.1 hypothetical protein BJ171DRAFT_598832 [Polychytrium aggregatum]